MCRTHPEKTSSCETDRIGERHEKWQNVNEETLKARLPDERRPWRAAISLGYRDGKALRKVYTAATRGEVKDKLTKALRDQQEGLPIVGEKETVGHFLAHWLEQVASTKVRPSALESYRWITEQHIVPGLGRYKLARLSAQEIQAFLNDRLKSGRQPHTKRTKNRRSRSRQRIRRSARARCSTFTRRCEPPLIRPFAGTWLHEMSQRWSNPREFAVRR